MTNHLTAWKKAVPLLLSNPRINYLTLSKQLSITRKTAYSFKMLFCEYKQAIYKQRAKRKGPAKVKSET